MEKKNGKAVVFTLLAVVFGLSLFAVYVGNVTRDVQVAEKKAAAAAAAEKAEVESAEAPQH
tara:strand:- start:1251 stop:1433 length:183 start_codon:yes stop_codon:yes gene_type:complete